MSTTLFNLEGKIALVTGASRGIGEEIAKLLAEQGAHVIVSSRKIDGCQAVADAIKADGGSAEAFACHVGELAQIEAVFSHIRDVNGKLDILVNNAGIAQRRGPMLEVAEAVFDRIYAVNVKSIYWGAIHAVPLLRGQPGGVIINIASTGAVSPRAGLTWYNGSKGAVTTLTKSMAAELAPEKIRVNAVNPVIGETGLTEAFMGGDTPDLREKIVSTIPLGRMSTPTDVANAVLYLASDEAALLTGVCLEVDGGRCI